MLVPNEEFEMGVSHTVEWWCGVRYASSKAPGNDDGAVHVLLSSQLPCDSVKQSVVQHEPGHAEPLSEQLSMYPSQMLVQQFPCESS